MRIEPGTRVKFLNDIGGGVVRGFSADNYAIVETDDGFEMPVPVNELLIDTSVSYEAGENRATGQNEASLSGKDAEISPGFEEKKYQSFQGEVFLYIVPQNDKALHVSNFDLYLINDSNYIFNYLISYRDSQLSTHIAEGSIDPDTKLEIESYTQTAISKLKELRLQGFFYKHGLMDTVTPVDQTSSLEGISFYKVNFFEENDFFHQKAIPLKKREDHQMEVALDSLKESDIGKVIELKEKAEKKKQHKSPKNDVLEEVDLHIEELVENPGELSNAEIVNTQLARFEFALDTALRGNTRKIVFIHGVGNGRLKHELRKKLERKYPELRYQDASFKEYGYGATMVYIR